MLPLSELGMAGLPALAGASRWVNAPRGVPRVGYRRTAYAGGVGLTEETEVRFSPTADGKLALNWYPQRGRGQPPMQIGLMVGNRGEGNPNP